MESILEQDELCAKYPKPEGIKIKPGIILIIYSIININSKITWFKFRNPFLESSNNTCQIKPNWSNALSKTEPSNKLPSYET